MFNLPAEALECFSPSPTVYVAPAGLTFVIEPQKPTGCGAVFSGVVTEAEADRLDSEVIASRRGGQTEPLDKTLLDLGLS
jgi:hypothetical protein